MPTATHRLAAATAVLCLGLGALGCSGSDDDAGDASTTTTAPAATSTTAPTTTAAPTTAAPTTAAPETTAPATTAAPTTTEGEPGGPTTVVGGSEADEDQAALDLFVSLRADHCTGETPEPAGTQPGSSASEVVVVDVEGNRLIIDVAEQVVTGLDGPEGMLPAAYSFGCDPEVFVGTLPN